jgi:hypothetical protein
VTAPEDVVVLLDCDNTLLANDLVQIDCMRGATRGLSCQLRSRDGQSGASRIQRF